jgi:hypothetical protein
MTEIQLPPDVLARVEGAELQNLITKVKNGGVLSPQERQALAKLTEKYGPKQPETSNDPVAVSQDEGSVSQRVNRQQKLARVQVVGEWLVSGHSNQRMYHFAAKRWGVSPRSVDSLIADAKRMMADPRNTARSYFRAVHFRRLTEHYHRRSSGADPRDPMEPLRELAKFLGLNEPDRAHVEQVIAAPEDAPRVQVFIPDNGRSVVPRDAAELP